MATLTVKGIPALLKQIDAGRQPRYDGGDWQFDDRKKPNAPCRVHDGDGLYLIHKPGTNSTSWEYRYTWAGAKQQIRLGSLARISLGDARKKRRACERLLDDDKNPMAERKAQREAEIAKRNRDKSTFTGRVWAWSDDYHQREHLTDSTKVRNERLIGYLEKDLGKSPVGDITRKMVLKCVRRIESENGKESAVRALALAHLFFESMMVKHEDIVKGDPTTGIRKELGKVTDTPRAAVVQEQDIGHLLRSIDGYPNPVIRAAMQMMAHTFLRSNELRFAKWSEVDFERKEWIIPVARMKYRRDEKAKELDHYVPLTQTTLKILQDLHAITGGDPDSYIFPAVRKGRPISENTINMALKSLGFDGRTHTQHGFRKLAATRLAALKFDTVLVKRQSGRLDGGIEGVYNRYDYRTEREKMMRAWSRYLDALRKGAKVFAIGTKKGVA